LAAAATVAVCVAVSLVIVVGPRSAHHRSAVHRHEHVVAPVIRNYAPGPVPALGGQLVCDATLTASPSARSATATIVVHTGPGASHVFSLRASALKPAPAGDRYEVWALAETNDAFGGYQRQRGAAPRLLGVIAPPVMADGLLAARGTIPPSFTGPYRVLITVQRAAAKSPGRVVLRGDIPL
jgi:hypothetical protein